MFTVASQMCDANKEYVSIDGKPALSFSISFIYCFTVSSKRDLVSVHVYFFHRFLSS
jgi:hypothetical protein